MKKNLKLALFVLIFLATQSSLYANDKIRIVATTRTFASIAQTIAGDNVEIHSVASPNRDIHFIQPTPKDVLKVKKADVLIHGGLDLEAWREPLLIAAGNRNFLGGGKSAIDVSNGIQLLEVPTSISRAEGDIHIFGNPHYWMDPENAKIIAKNIADGLSDLYPANAESYQKNLAKFLLEIDQKIKDWDTRMAPYQGIALVTYHNSWPYFAKHFKLEVIGQLEPKPGIPPTAKHLRDLSKFMKEKKAGITLKESYQDNSAPKKIASETGAEVLTLAQSVGASKEAMDYVSMMDFNIESIARVLEKEKSHA